MQIERQKTEWLLPSRQRLSSCRLPPNIMRTPVLPLFIAAASAASLLSSCGMMRAITPDHMPDLLPSRNTIAAIVPGIGPVDKAGADDPQVPFNSRGILGHGHTLRIEVYEGARSASRIYDGVTMVDSQGILPLGEVGSARVGGLRLPQAAEAIAAAFRLQGRNTRPLTVQILSVEFTPVVSINGDVRQAEFIPVFEGMTVRSAVDQVGGRRPGSTSRGVYISREGQRNFFPSLDAAEARWKPRAGDIITLSPDI